ncbi:Glucose 1-dehydrogenase B [uncultured Roseburia sp.]|uniref:SDR family oxidoreductase n=1 Tax=Brotonthovivens ammoniilytica TaxID=2981725 RepID=A0ABT2TME8_9FIRM|nr:SDR family oxidoreductase [Brotonthovivens ammoniilytica]MCU6763404.1 SDR family oxidoreductase [Brotonthovivens ammoniilytica]SCJ18063.1 Glucose 1-dehydrogenase B [uncultured Roseburia sp.]
MGLLEGKTAVITGANSGIGKKTAIMFANEGANVVLAARRLEKLKEVEAEIVKNGGRAISVQGDVSVKEDCEKIADTAFQFFGAVDILVNNAGMADKHRPITRCSDEWWKEICQVNQDSVFYMTRAALKYMENQSLASIVNVSSIGGVFANSGIAYSATKAAVIAMTKNVAIQFAGKGIRCNAVCPGPTPTPLNTPEQLATFDKEFADLCSEHMYMQVPEASVEDQANAILYFSSDMSKAVTGQVLVVDYGCTL